MPHALQVVPPSTEATQDGLLHLARNLTIHPDTLVGRGMGIFGAGMIGAGKTTVMARLFEQFGSCGLPFVIFDLEGDLASLIPLLPRGVLATASNCPTARDLYQEGLQVVFALESFEMEQAADIITTTVDGLMQHATALPPHLRVPFLIGIDEIAHWVPQRRAGHEHLSPERLKALHACLSTLVSRGRKRGLVPCFFTQRFAHVHKDVLSPGTFILMRTTLDTDLARYMEYVDASAFTDGADLTMRQVKARIAKFKEGQGIVKLPSGKQGVVQFYNRESEHLSHAPKTQAAMNAYRDVVVDKGKQYGAFRSDEETHEQKHEQGAQPTVLLSVASFGKERPASQPASPTEKSVPMPIPVLPDKGPHAEEIDLATAITLWNSGYNSRRKLAQVFGLTQYQAGLLAGRIKEQAKRMMREG